ncbi:MAG: ATP-binding protein [Sedimentisphaerales bacterium]|nr:ATP-binding protein [Sedimentisphaerales bacterium]
MIKRHMEKSLVTAAREYPVVILIGPRQSGKTTLVRTTFTKHRYTSLENPDTREFASEDPRGFLDQFTGSVILDEIQRVPDLFSYIQGIVDETDKAGQFILTGSQNFLLMEKVTQSLAGRCAVLHLLPFTRSELAGRATMDVSTIGKKIPRRKVDENANLFDHLFIGGYPRIYDKQLEPHRWLANYYHTYVERDVRQVLNVGDTEAFGRFIRLCAGRCGQLLNMASLAADCGMSAVTVKRWLSMLEASYLVVLLRPHHKNFRKRLVKAPKLYFLDSGLLCYLLRIRSSEDLRIHALRGAVFESWVVSELLKTYYNDGVEPDIHFWRDSTGYEIDIIMDRGIELVPVEIKSGQTISSDSFKGLDYWRSLPGQEKSPSTLVYGGNASYARNKTTVISWQHWG